jgi:alkanesulfonate monooxygenase SsuD/methylene tetrahydromethanopterin reductase-like flavin-dependent oxidoreductase (luciferase family)
MGEARDSAAAAFDRLSAFVAEDQRFGPKVPDAPAQSGAFKISEDEFITGTPKEVAEQIIEQCKATGAGNFLAVLHWSAPIEEVERAHELFGREVIPLLRAAAV